jgi:DNA invertase Pin-like site-specific DNA recombinase
MPRRKGGRAVGPSYDFSGVQHILVPYRRASTREQATNGASLPAQKTKIEYGLGFREQQALTWDCVDGGKTGENLDRPGFRRAMAHIYAGEASGIICSKLDRLTRDLLDFATITDTAKSEGWNIVLLDVGVDLHTPIGRMMAGILAIFAQFERELIVERTNDGLDQKRANGVRLGRKRIISDELLAAVIGAYHLEGGYSAAARFLNAAAAATPNGGREWYPATVQKIVQSQDGRKYMQQWELVA